MKKLFFSWMLWAAALQANAQVVDLSKQFKNMKPRAIGPSGMSGRITTIDALHQNTNTIYVGAASGGVWKTENAGNDWAPVFDEQPIQNIGSLAVCQTNPSIVWVGTGEGNPRNSVNIGEGIYKSMDAGKTWKCMGLEKTRNIHRVIIDPTNPNIVYAGAIGNPFAAHSERGVFKTTDGGETWTKVLYTNDSSGVADMIMDSKNPNKIFAAMWQHNRTPWSFSSGGKGSGLYVTYDACKTWKKLNGENGLPTGNYGRIGITLCHDMPNRVYALIESTKSALYRSDDGGVNWVKVNDDPAYTANRSFYFQDVICDPQNENRLWLINQIVSMSEDGGKTFKTVIPYNGIHPDHHAFWINPLDPSFIIDGNDGGIGITRDKGKNWLFDEKLPVGQFYHINVDDATPYNVMGGMQDNGSWRGPAYTWTKGGLKNYYWESLWGGDGFDVMPDPEDNNWVYAMSQGGNVGRYNIVTGESWDIKPPSVVNTVNKDRLRFNWNAAIAQDPFDKKTIYFGSQFLHKSTNKGASWVTLSGDLTTNDSAKIDQSKNGGISIDITGAENHCTIIAIEPSKINQNVIWVTTDDGNVQLSKDGGKTFTNCSPKIIGLPKGAWLPQVRASRYNAAEAMVVANDYRRGNMATMVFRTTDYGATWTNILQNKNVKGYALTVLQDPVEPNLIFVGTEQGLWISFDNANTFQQFKNGYPSVSTYDLVIQEREADLCIATFGRAIYILDDIKPLRKLAAQKGQINKPFMLFGNTEAYQLTFKNAPGYEWSTWGVWDATNKRTGAALNFYAMPQAKTDTANKAKKEPKLDTLLVKIYDANNQPIRSLEFAVDSGFNKKYWSMNEKGFRAIGSEKPKPNAPEPSGDDVLPGTYKVVYTFNKMVDSNYVTVKADPRKPDNTAIVKAQRALANTLRTTGATLTTGIDQLNDADAIVKKVEAQLKDIETPIADSIRKQSKKISEQIKDIKDFVSGKKIERQGYGQLPQETVLTAYNEALGNINEKTVAPGEQEIALVNKATNKINEAVKKINTFFNSNWKQYQQLVENNKVNLFKEFKEL
ncbi:WD40/YVTN/BNR-like repeat-containing protein [Ferruginibacter yonginensis]|uniref:WD40/YVTN/BNR-like repeat-containing protein n=1 Tax=Ferruginibacter yonginensis TaxID=1310416 RepID=A0ABV8QPS6_9BACT